MKNILETSENDKDALERSATAVGLECLLAAAWRRRCFLGDAATRMAALMGVQLVQLAIITYADSMTNYLEPVAL